MKRPLQIVLAFVVAAAAVPSLAQRGGGHAGGGGFRGGAAPAFRGAPAPAFRGGYAGPRYYAPAPSYSGMRIDSTGIHPAPPTPGYGYGYRGYGYGFAPGRTVLPSYGVRAPYAGHRPVYGPPNYGPGRRPHRPYYPPYLGGFGFGYPWGYSWLGASVLPGFPLYGYPYYSPFSDWDYDWLDYDEPYDDGSGYGYTAPAYPEPTADPNAYSGNSYDGSGYYAQPYYAQPYAAYAEPQPEQPQTYVVPAQPEAEPEPPVPVTLIFKDGRQPEKIRNYIATATSIRVVDGQRHYDIPVADLDLDATIRANQAAGVDFHLPPAGQ